MLSADRITVLVTDAERPSALCVIRSLGRAGHSVIAVSTKANALGGRSRYVSRICTVPNPALAAADYVVALISLVVQHQVAVVVPITESSLIPISAERHRLPDFCRLAAADEKSLACALDKNRTIEAAIRLGVPTPMSAFVATEDDARDVLADSKWPVVVKPQFSVLGGEPDGFAEGDHEAGKISYANSLEDVLLRVRSARGRYGFLLQEYCGGAGGGLELLVWNGHIQSAFQHRRLAEVPITGGASALRESVPVDSNLLAHCADLVREFHWSGLCMIEFRGEGSAARLMEMNGRIWGSIPLAVHSGMDFPAKMMRLLLEEETPITDFAAIDQNYEVGCRAYNPDLLAVWFGSVFRSNSHNVPVPTRSDMLSMAKLAFAAKSDLADADDPEPARGTLNRIARKILAKVGS